MMTRPPPVPKGYATVTPWVVTNDAEELGVVEVESGAIGHAEARIGDSIIMMFDSPFPGGASRGGGSPQGSGPS